MYHPISYFILASSFFEYRMPFHALHMPPYLNTPMHIMTIANLSTYLPSLLFPFMSPYSFLWMAEEKLMHDGILRMVTTHKLIEMLAELNV